MLLQTGRLVIRDLEEGDRSAVQGWRSDPDVMRYLDQPVESDPSGWFDNAVRRNAQLPRLSYDAAVVARETGEVIGWIGIGRSFDILAGDWVVGYALRRDSWGHGFMTEALRAVLGYAFADLGAQTVYADCYAANPGSARVMEKAGMRYSGRVSSANPALGESLRHAVNRNEWSPPGRRRIGLIVVAVLVAVLAVPVAIGQLLAWSDRPDTPDDPRLLSWQARGSLGRDEAFLDDVEEVWRREASPGEAPGEQVFALWAGVIGAGRIAVLQSVTPSGDAYVAQVAEHGAPPTLTLDRADPLRGRPAALTIDYDGNVDLPMMQPGAGAALLQMLLAPAGPDGSEGHTLWRRVREDPDRTGVRWDPLAVRRDGVTRTWLHLDSRSPQGSVVVVARRNGDGTDAVRTVAARPQAVVPGRPSIRLADPTWGSMARLDLAVYDDARAVRNALGNDYLGEVGLLEEKADRIGRIVVLEVRLGGAYRVVLVAWEGPRVACVAVREYPYLPSRSVVALGCSDPRDGRLTVAAVPRRSVDRTEVRWGDRPVEVLEGGQAAISRLPADQRPTGPIVATAFDESGDALDRDQARVSETP